MQKFTILLLSLVILGPLSIDLYLPTLPDIAIGLSIPVATVQTTVPLFLLIIGLGQIVVGPLVDNFGRKPIVMIGLLLYICGSILAAGSLNWPMFLLARILQGCAVCCTTVVAFSGVRDQLVGNEAAQVYNFLSGALNIVPALAPILGGFLSEIFDWRASFWFLICYALFVILITNLLLPETRPANIQKIKYTTLRQYSAILCQPNFLVFALANAGTMGMVLTYVSLAPHVLMTESHMSTMQFSVTFGMNGFWVILASVMANKTIRKAGRPLCFAIGMLAILAGATLIFAGEKLFPIYLQKHWVFYMLPVAISVAGFAFTVGPATSYALDPYHQQIGIASALAGFIQMTGGALVSLFVISLPLTEKHALALTMLLSAMLIFLAWQYSKKISNSPTIL